jgi:EAL domain-containing protein (putative c-di-GMP-specific phosphodiesterase class I)
LVDDPDAAAIRLDALREAGFSTAIDDFGTGFSSLGALRRMPFHTLKIDRQFLSVDGDAKANAELIGGIIRIGHAMGQTIVCEGVETGAQADLLARIGCDLLQGYHFGRPMPIDDLLAAFPAAPGARRVTGS